MVQSCSVRESVRVLGQMLLSEGGITSEQLSLALNEQQTTRERLGEILARGGVDPELIARALARQLGNAHASTPSSAATMPDRAVPARTCVRIESSRRHRQFPPSPGSQATTR